MGMANLELVHKPNKLRPKQLIRNRPTAVSVSAEPTTPVQYLMMVVWSAGRNTTVHLESAQPAHNLRPNSWRTGRFAVSVIAGDYHTCAVLDDGSLKCWGRNSYGALGIGGTTGSGVQYPTPQAVDLGTGRTAVSLSAGSYHTCAILDDGTLKCWGYNYYGELESVGLQDGMFIIQHPKPSI